MRNDGMRSAGIRDTLAGSLRGIASSVSTGLGLCPSGHPPIDAAVARWIVGVGIAARLLQGRSFFRQTA